MSAVISKAIDDVIKSRPKEPHQESARRLIDYYREPHEHSASQLVWYATKDGWKRTVLSREEVPHARGFQFRLPGGNTNDPDESGS